MWTQSKLDFVVFINISALFSSQRRNVFLLLLWYCMLQIMHFVIVELSNFLFFNLVVECIMSFSASVVLILVSFSFHFFLFYSPEAYKVCSSRYFNCTLMNNNKERINNTHSFKFITVYQKYWDWMELARPFYCFSGCQLYFR